jgi:AcrR family transcriptional regulator
MADVLAEAGLSAGAVYRYFPGKADIVQAIAGEAVEQLTAAWEHVLTVPELPPLEDALTEVLMAIERLDRDHGTPQLAVQVWAEAVRSPAMADLAKQVFGRIRRLAAQLVVRYQERGDIAADIPAEAVARVIVGLLPGFVLQRVLIGDVQAAEFRAGLHALLAP